jgi:ribonuclease HI
MHLFEADKNGGWGAICRNSEAEYQFAGAGPLVLMTDALHAKATSLSNAIQIAKKMGVGCVIFETDLHSPKCCKSCCTFHGN